MENIVGAALLTHPKLASFVLRVIPWPFVGRCQYPERILSDLSGDLRGKTRMNYGPRIKGLQRRIEYVLALKKEWPFLLEEDRKSLVGGDYGRIGLDLGVIGIDGGV